MALMPMGKGIWIHGILDFFLNKLHIMPAFKNCFDEIKNEFNIEHENWNGEQH